MKSHRNAVEIVRFYLKEKGYGFLPENHTSPHTFADIVASRKGRVFSVEVKATPVTKREAMVGLGQSLYSYLVGFSPYLALGLPEWEFLSPVAPSVPWLGFLIYGDTAINSEIAPSVPPSNPRPLALYQTDKVRCEDCIHARFLPTMGRPCNDILCEEPRSRNQLCDKFRPRRCRHFGNRAFLQEACP